MTPLKADAALDEYFLEVRCRLLDAAAILDRIDRGQGEGATDDPRMRRIREAIAALAEPGAGRAEKIQQIFSLDYDPEWVRPEPRSV